MNCKFEKRIKDCFGIFCPEKYLNDGQCDNGQNDARENCDFSCDEFMEDGYDCTAPADMVGKPKSSKEDIERMVTFYPFGDVVCSTPLGNCTYDLLHNNRCDPVCQFEQCNWDFFDCCRSTFTSDDLNTTLMSFTLEAYGNESNPFPKPGDEVQRFVTHSKNVLLGGIMMRQKRWQVENCSDSTFDNLKCVAEKDGDIVPEYQPFGADAVFLNASQLFSSLNVKQIKACYPQNESVMDLELALPFGFHFVPYTPVADLPGQIGRDYVTRALNHIDKLAEGDVVMLPGGQCKEGGMDHFDLEFADEDSITNGFYPIFFDNKFSEDSVNKLLTYLQEGFYIDKNTSEVQVEFVAYNAEGKFYSLVKVGFEFDNSGVLAVDSKVKILQNSAYDFDSLSVRRFVLEIAFVLLYLFQIALEIHELKKLGHKWPEYFMDFSNILDITSLALIGYQIYQWIVIAYSTARFGLVAHTTFPVYAPIPNCGQARRLYYNLTALTQVQYMYDILEEVASLMDQFQLAACFSMLLMLARTFKQLDFQPRLALITRTLSEAFWDLFHFVILLMLVLLPYSFMGYIFYGNTKSEFSTMADASITLLQFLVGEAGPYTDGPGPVSSLVHNLYFATFVFLNVWIMLNVLVGILVEAYLTVKQKSGIAPTIFHEVRDLLRQQINVFRYRPTKKNPDKFTDHDNLIKMLDVWLDTANKKEDQLLGSKTERRIVIDGFEMDRADLQRIIRAHLTKLDNPELDGEKEDAHINLAVRTLVAHFGAKPNSGLSTKVCSKLLAKKRDTARVTPHDCFEESDVEDLSVTHRNAAAPHSGNFDKKVAIATVVGGS